MTGHTVRFLFRTGLTVVGLLALYAVIPVPGQHEPLWFTFLMALAGLGVLGFAFVALAKRAQSADNAASQTSVRLEAVVAVLYAFVVFSSLVYLAMAQTPGQISGLHTRIDALYFTMSTIGTVGFGDIHATGQAARVMVTIQIFVDLIFIGLVARIIVPHMTAERSRRLAEEQQQRARAQEGTDDVESPSAST